MGELNLVILGPPGAGKGTQGERLAEETDLPYYATGDILRAAVKEESELGREAKGYMTNGDLIPDEVMSAVIRERVDSREAADGFVLDGFPRNVRQAEELESALDRLDRSLTAVIVLAAGDEEVVRRLSGRRVCEESGHLYHVEFDPPKHEGVCDQDGSKLIQRDDDHPDTIRHRLEVYREQTSPLADLYESSGTLRRFDGTRSTTEVHDHIRATLAVLRRESEL